MFSFMAGVASGMYIYHKYDVEKFVEDVKPSSCSTNHKEEELNKSSEEKEEGKKWSTEQVWNKIKSFEQQYRKPDKDSKSQN